MLQLTTGLSQVKSFFRLNFHKKFSCYSKKTTSDCVKAKGHLQMTIFLYFHILILFFKKKSKPIVLHNFFNASTI